MMVPHTSLNSHTGERERRGIKTRTNIFCIQLLFTRLRLEKLLLPFVVLKTCFTKSIYSLYQSTISDLFTLTRIGSSIFHSPNWGTMLFQLVFYIFIFQWIFICFHLFNDYLWFISCILFYGQFSHCFIIYLFFLKREFKNTHFCIWKVINIYWLHVLVLRLSGGWTLCTGQEFAWA